MPGKRRREPRYFLWLGIILFLVGGALAVGSAMAGPVSPIGIVVPFSLAALGVGFLWHWRTERSQRPPGPGDP
ncbi:hypothetical protein JD292_02455 [Leucobacter sp. CSA2]|uniref:Uncharacterized protein n=1 Tax=Leucobacter edaphi TaxID=2796472 RepID=A0A934QB85_9MICO|nr:hypothetical protein [Leucobacter edaphi]MBK0420943.1 hypothetical protein [Leucobacter edaphi]